MKTFIAEYRTPGALSYMVVRVSGAASTEDVKAMLHKNGVSPTNVTLAPIGATLAEIIARIDGPYKVAYITAQQAKEAR